MPPCMGRMGMRMHLEGADPTPQGTNLTTSRYINLSCAWEMSSLAGGRVGGGSH